MEIKRVFDIIMTSNIFFAYLLYNRLVAVISLLIRYAKVCE